jgi:hypothetical protein
VISVFLKGDFCPGEGEFDIEEQKRIGTQKFLFLFKWAEKEE